jgi:hypothetical protein
MSREGSPISRRPRVQLLPTSSSFSPPVDPAWRRYNFPSPIPHSPSPCSSIFLAVRIGFQAAAAPGSVQFKRRQRSVAVLAAASRHRSRSGMRVFFFPCSFLSWHGVTQRRSWYTLFPERSSSSPPHLNLIGSTDLPFPLTLCDAYRASPSCHGQIWIWVTIIFFRWCSSCY